MSAGLAGVVRLDRICVVMMSTIGNAVHVLPVLNALKRHHPAAHISWVIQPGPATLLHGHAAVDEIIPFHRRRGWRGLLDLRRELAKREFDLVLDFQVYFKAGLVTGMTRAPVKLGFDRARAKELNWLFTTHRLPPRPLRHVQDGFLEFLEQLGVPAGPLTWDLGPWVDERSAQRAFFEPIDRPVAALVVGGSREQTGWVPARWAELVDALYHDHGLQPMLVGGGSPRELEVERVIRERAVHRPISTLGAPLRELVWLLDGAALVISVDTGPLHLARALGRPIVSLLGHYDPRRTGPYRHCPELIIDAYHEPGEVVPISAATRPDRMQRITTTQVREKVEIALERYVRPPSSRAETER
jgi:heptosyltransferase I